VINRTVYAVKIAVSVGYFLCIMCLVPGVAGYEGIAVLYWRCMDEMYTLGFWPLSAFFERAGYLMDFTVLLLLQVFRLCCKKAPGNARDAI